MSTADPTGQSLLLVGAESSPAWWRLRLVIGLKGLDWLDGGPAAPAWADGPLLGIGRDLFIGDMAGMLALEAARGEPTLFPNGNRGMPLALRYWSDRVMETARAGVPDRAQLRLIARQLDDGRDFLQGAQPGLADIQSAAPLLALGHKPEDDVLAPWLARIRQNLLGPSDGPVTLSEYLSRATGQLDSRSQKDLLHLHPTGGRHLPAGCRAFTSPVS